MTYETAYSIFKSNMDQMIKMKNFDGNAFDVKKCAIVISALGKQINRCVDVESETTILVCPTCRHEFHKKTRQKYCDECGQRLSWANVR